jgi:AcrR family transcriptional regulator
MAMMMNKNAERGQATRERLIEIATRLFATRGYDGTSIEAVLQESGVSRGSLYHHFAGKDALFGAVLEDVEAGIGARLAEEIHDAPDPVAALRAGCLAWIRLATDPVVQQIMLIDAPSVLGWQRWRELDEQHTLGDIKIALTYAVETGRLPPQQVDVSAHILMAAINEVALMIARADDAAKASAEGERAVQHLLDGMLSSD